MHHAHREQHSHVVEIIDPGNAAASPADIYKYVLCGRPGAFVMEVNFHGKPPDWWITVQSLRRASVLDGPIIRPSPRSCSGG